MLFLRKLLNIQIKMDNKRIVKELRGFQGRLILMRDENKKHYETKNAELKELTDDISNLIRSVESGAGINGSGVNGGVQRQINQLLSPAKRSASGPLLIPVPKRERKDLNEDESGYTIVYTDGACSNNGRVDSRAGVGVWWGDGSTHNIGEPVKGDRHTNNTAEIQAATFAICQARGLGVRKLNIHTDSQFLINCMTKWIQNWKRNNWMTASKQPVKNKEDLETLEIEMNKGGVAVKWTHVAGHAGIHGNEEADRLARAGAEANRS